MKERTLSLSLLLASWLCHKHRALALSSVVTVQPNDESCFLFHTPPHWKEDMKRNPRYLWGDFELMNRGQDVSAVPLVVYMATYNLETTLYRSRKGQASGHFDVALQADNKYWFCVANHQEQNGKASAKEGAHGSNGSEGAAAAAGPEEEEEDEDEEPDDMPRTVGFTVYVVTGDEFDYTDLGGNPIEQDEDEATKAHREARERAGLWVKAGSKLGQRLRELKHHFDYLSVREAEHRAVTEKTFTDVLTWSLAQAGAVAIVAVCQIFYFRRYLERGSRYQMLG